jgi:hypothetical protein
VEPSAFFAMPIATPSANSSGRLEKIALPAAPITAAILLPAEPVGTEEVRLAQAQQQRGDRKRRDRQHEAAAELLKRREVETPLLLLPHRGF